MRCLLFACTLISAIAGDRLATPTAAELRKAVTDGYGKVDRLSISCFFVDKENYEGEPVLCMGSLEYRFDRQTRRLAIGAQQEPGLLVNGKEFFFVLWHENNGDPTYLKVNKTHPVRWNDVDETMRVVRKDCPLCEFSCCFACSGFVLPFLEGGVERLLPPNTKVLSLADPNQTARRIALGEQEPLGEQGIFGLGHPDYKVWIGYPKETPNLDPKRFPICFKTEDKACTWTWAFDPQSGTLSAAVGIVDPKGAWGVPGNNHLVLLKKIVSFDKDDFGGRVSSVPLCLPENAKTVEFADLKASYYRTMREPCIQRLPNKETTHGNN